jgi:electron transport complex protein RnfG
MSTKAQIPKQENASSTKMLRAMLGIGILSAFLIVSAFELTRPRVERLKAEALQKAVFNVLPGTESTRAFGINAQGELVDKATDEKAEYTCYAGYDQNQHLVGYAVEAAGQGYADIIRILYGYDPKEQVVIGFQVLESKETPGLGDKIEKEQRFLDNFKALDVGLTPEGQLKNKIKTVKQGEKQNPWEIDGITGATISSRAIGNIIAASTSEVVPMLHGQSPPKVETEPKEKPVDSNE